MKQLIFSFEEQSIIDSGYRIIDANDPIPNGYTLLAKSRAEKILRLYNSFESNYYALIDAVNSLGLKLT